MTKNDANDNYINGFFCIITIINFNNSIILCHPYIWATLPRAHNTVLHAVLETLPPTQVRTNSDEFVQTEVEATIIHYN